MRAMSLEMVDEIEISHGDPHEPGAAALLTASNALMEALFDPEAEHSIGMDELSRPDVFFLVARRRGEVVGTGALIERGGYGEIKSMFVGPTTLANTSARPSSAWSSKSTRRGATSSSAVVA